MNTMLDEIYQALYSHYGDLGWWPADSPFEVMVGAVLTQNTAWRNVEKALANFKGDLSPERVLSLAGDELQEIIRPAGFYRQKAGYLKAISSWFLSYGREVSCIKKRPLEELRSELLDLRGVGNETADSILLYAFDLPSFVVDAYTRRLLGRIPLKAGNNYMEVKDYFEKDLPRDSGIYKNFHALFVENGKNYCKKKPKCTGCPLEPLCEKRTEG